MMNAFFYQTTLQWKLNFRNKELLLFYYAVPLVFYFLIGGIFTSIMPDANLTLIQAMTVFGITMGGVLGSPYPLIEFYASEEKNAYQVGHIPLWTVAAGNFIAAIVHLFVMSMVIYFTAPLFFDAVLPENPAAYFLSLFLMIIASLSVGTAFGLCIKSSAKSGMMTQIVFLPSVMLSGIMFPANLLPNFLQQVGKVLPATWGFQNMCASEITFQTLWPLLLITFVAAAISVWRLIKIKKPL